LESTRTISDAQKATSLCLLDSIETTAILQLPHCYADYRRSKHLIEFSCARQLYEELDHADLKNRVSQLNSCRQYAYFARNSETGKIRVISNSCHLRWCPVCSDVKRVRIRSAVSEWLSHVRRPKFITLTMSHTTIAIETQIKKLYRAFRLLRQHKFIKQAMRGGIWFFQIKKSKDGNRWHPHLHIVADSDFIDKRLLSLEWFETTGDSYIVDIQEVKKEDEVSEYVSRYCSKPCKLSDFTKTDRHKIADVLHGKRLCGRFGTGAKCDFKSRPVKGTSEWQRLGNWSDFISNRPFDRTVQSIMLAWVRDEPVEYDICKALILQENPETTVPAISPIVPKYRQAYFVDFVHL